MQESPAEQGMWVKPPREIVTKMTDDQINEKYALRQERIVTESNREMLPNFVEALKRPGHITLRPFYQRRPRWDPERQSKLIESFIINIPIPPVFFYETAYNTYEVMDGQQRISTILAFYTNELKLEGLERWPELNGKTYSKLPTKIRAGVDRRSISYVVLQAESAKTEEDAMLLKQIVFERLNTGGIELSKQEIRNSFYQSDFNKLLMELSRNRVFRKAWRLPPPSENEEANPPEALRENPFYSKMEDAEVILRFFALRHVTHYQRGMQGFLDLYMARSRSFVETDISFLRSHFEETISLAAEIFGDLVFRPFDVKKGDWSARPQKAFWDAVMVGVSQNLGKAAVLRSNRDQVIQRTRALFTAHPEGTFTGRGNTKQDVEERVKFLSDMLASVAPGSA